MARQADAFIALPGTQSTSSFSPVHDGSDILTCISFDVAMTGVWTPGGYGTMEELLEMITWSQLGIHDKPVSISIWP